MSDDLLRYPIGRFALPATGNESARLAHVKQIGALPERLAELVQELRDRKLLDEAYRPGGWTAREVIHHLADSHVNAYCRHRFVLTEDHPTLLPYDEVSWAELPDVIATPVAASLEILRGLHLRWAVLLAQCTDTQWARTAYHPGSGITYHLDTLAAHYAWHGAHHLAHLGLVLDRPL